MHTVVSTCRSVWPNGLGLTPVGAEGLGSDPRGGQLDTGFHPIGRYNEYKLIAVGLNPDFIFNLDSLAEVNKDD